MHTHKYIYIHMYICCFRDTYHIQPWAPLAQRALGRRAYPCSLVPDLGKRSSQCPPSRPSIAPQVEQWFRNSDQTIYTRTTTKVGPGTPSLGVYNEIRR